MELGKQSDPRKGYHFLKAMPRVLPPVCAKFGYLFYFSGWKIVIFLHCLQLGGYENVDGRNWLSVIYQCHLRCLWFFRWTNWSLEESCSERSDFPTYVFQDYIFQRITYTLFHLCLSILLQKTIYFIASEKILNAKNRVSAEQQKLFTDLWYCGCSFCWLAVITLVLFNSCQH